MIRSTSSFIIVIQPHNIYIGKFIPTRRTPGISTSNLLERIIAGYRNCDFDEKLAKMGHAELRAEGISKIVE
jgi:hypothetical protein